MLRQVTRALARVACPLLLVASATACGGDDELPAGPIGRAIADAASEHGVPVDLVLAIADVEGGLDLPPIREVHDDDLVLVAGALELRHGRFDSLRRGAELTGRSEVELAADAALGTRAGVMVLADLSREHGVIRRDRLEAWAPVVEQLSGHATRAQREEYRARVYARLRRGGLLAARDGEVILLAEHEEIPFMLTVVPPVPKTQDEAEYPGAVWIETSCADKCNTSRNAEISMVAIHDTEGDWDASVATLQNDSGKSVHYIIDADGSRIGQFIPESYNGWHVGNSHYNNRMVGIEHVGVAGKDDYQTALYEASAALVKDIATRHGLTVDRNTLVAHQEVPDGVNIPQDSPPCPDRPDQCIESGNYGGFSHHHDPGVYWEWCQFMELAGGVCKCTDTWELWNCVHDLSMMNRCVDGVVEIVHCADNCVVEPIGTDDHCTPLSDGSGGGGSSSGAGASGGEGSGGSSTGGSGDDSFRAEAEGEADSGCACRAGAPARERAGLYVFALLAALCVRRRRGLSANTD